MKRRRVADARAVGPVPDSARSRSRSLIALVFRFFGSSSGPEAPVDEDSPVPQTDSVSGEKGGIFFPWRIFSRRREAESQTRLASEVFSS